MEIIEDQLLDQVSRKAKENQRLRMNYNFHTSPEAGAQRLLNALEPGTELPIHRHTHTAETYLVIRGKIKVLLYNDMKQITDTVVLDPLQGNYGVNIPIGQWHTLEVLASGTVIFEVKDGPYTPISEENILI
ncbi:WbuC family cupin fold metalloprotein [Culturomica massiliensis]|uniref:WbuC family cupin fold metalloprotein n=1 Tax=Culturomica massiliensis TaxID=1841857 RepID=UPI000838284B|nr:WbuC family cupin fold metalloprotein [Culturomica massiliensis]